MNINKKSIIFLFLLGLITNHAFALDLNEYSNDALKIMSYSLTEDGTTNKEIFNAKKARWIKGRERGIEHQLEKLDNGDKYSQRTYYRSQLTREKNLYTSDSGSTIDYDVNYGLITGWYVGSELSDKDADFGDTRQVISGLIADTSVAYKLNTSYISPFIGLVGDVEVTTLSRIEWQADALVGATFAVADNKELTIEYQKPLVHSFDYFEEGWDLDQDEGDSIGIVGTLYKSDGTSHSIKLRYERFERSDTQVQDDGFRAYEPKTDNWLVSYKKTF